MKKQNIVCLKKTFQSFHIIVPKDFLNFFVLNSEQYHLKQNSCRKVKGQKVLKGVDQTGRVACQTLTKWRRNKFWWEKLKL